MNDQEVIKALRELLKDQDKWIKQAVIEALGNILEKNNELF